MCLYVVWSMLLWITTLIKLCHICEGRLYIINWHPFTSQQMNKTYLLLTFNCIKLWKLCFYNLIEVH